MGLIVKSAGGMRAAAGEFLKKLKLDGDHATVVGLVGELGAGKTTFVQAVGSALGIKEKMASPTYVIEKIYELPKNKKFHHLIHIDAYRLENSKELADLGFASLVSNHQNLILIEWAERVAELLPATAHHLNFEFVNPATRVLSTDIWRID